MENTDAPSLAEQIEAVFMDCLYTGEEVAALKESGKDVPDGAVVVEAITCKLGFHPDRIEKHKDEIRGFLNQMPAVFHDGGGGGGHSFLNMCETKDGEQWGQHKNMEQLMSLGIAAGMAFTPFPRMVWPALPGGMPYIIISTGMYPQETADDQADDTGT